MERPAAAYTVTARSRDGHSSSLVHSFYRYDSEASGRLSMSFASLRSRHNSRSGATTGPLFGGSRSSSRDIRNSRNSRNSRGGIGSAPLVLRGDLGFSSRNNSGSYSLNQSCSIPETGEDDDVEGEEDDEDEDNEVVDSNNYLPTVSSVLYPTPHERMNALVDDCVEQLGMCPYHYVIVALLGLSNVADSVEVMSIGFILTVYRDADGNKVSDTESSFLAAACFVGMLFGGLICGLMVSRPISII